MNLKNFNKNIQMDIFNITEGQAQDEKIQTIVVRQKIIVFDVFQYGSCAIRYLHLSYFHKYSLSYQYYCSFTIFCIYAIMQLLLQQQMGSVESGETSCKPNFQRFRYIGKTDIYHFGQVDLFFDEVAQQEVLRTIYEFAVGVDTQEKMMQKLRKNNNNCPNLIAMVRIETQARSICASTNAYHVYFQYLPRTLQDIINQQKTPFPQSQVRLLLSSLLEAVRYINECETYHGDIFPQFIYLDERGQRRYKIFDSAYFNPLKHGYYRALEQASYCSPEVLANVSERRTFPLYNHFVSDTFSIGLACLYTMTLISPLAAYKTKTKEIDYYYIEMLLRIANRNGFSTQLINCVSLCVQLKNRPTAAEILDSFDFLKGLANGHKLSLRK